MEHEQEQAHERARSSGALWRMLERHRRREISWTELMEFIRERGRPDSGRAEQRREGAGEANSAEQSGQSEAQR